jgi:hypothetical protein
MIVDFGFLNEEEEARLESRGPFFGIRNNPLFFYLP